MTLSDTTALQSVADDFLSAYASGEPIAPPRTTIEHLDLAGAYRIQQLQEDAFVAAGRKVVGRKIGLTSLAMQRQLGVDSPDFGFFTEDLIYPDGAEIKVDQFIAPKVEPELAFILGADLTADASFAEVAAAVASTHLVIEIIDSRVRDWDIKLVDTVADNASCGAIILDHTPIEVNTEDLPQVSATMTIDGELAGTGTGADVMGHPLLPLQWLAGVLGEQGVPLKAGDIILTGSFCGAAPVIAGQRVEIDYGPYGTLSAAFI
ncbi:2-keto-4-pentenoate hydratase [Corynebacterium sp. A21]|uniref:2-keto-4-pentenoate hydratase n=1 Tax=Corynebacterium sp. A21 TaxID=3457318 RepID=UPI003FD25B56